MKKRIKILIMLFVFLGVILFFVYIANQEKNFAFVGVDVDPLPIQNVTQKLAIAHAEESITLYSTAKTLRNGNLTMGGLTTIPIQEYA